MTLADFDRKQRDWRPWLTRLAFGGALVLVIARATMPQFLRDVVPVAPLAAGELAAPRAVGPAVGAILDVACVACALLVLARLCVDRAYPLRRTWSAGLLLAVALWAMASALWASDRFAAAAGASTWVAAAALVFTFAQTTRTWSRFRVVAAAAAGLFLVNVGFGVMYRTLDLPGLRADFQKDKARLLAERGIEPEGVAAKQLENRVMKGQTGGFSASPNSYGATLVLLGFALAGVAWQRFRDRDEVVWGGILLLGLVPGAWVLWTTGSRAAMAAAALLAVGFLIVWPLRGMLLKRRALVFVAAVLLVLAGGGVVVGIGLWTGTLPQDSLAFRWNYWVGGWGVFLDHPLLGVGFGNFGDAYLLHRLPVAAEEVSDPHNLIVRFFTETGLVGGLLAVLWLARTGWELLRPARATADAGPTADVRPLVWLLLAAVALGVLAGVDLASDPGFVALEIVRRLLFAALLAMGLLMGSLRSAADPHVSPKGALASASLVIAGLLAVLLHATADVVLFEPPVLMAFALLLGASLGIRAPDADPPPAARFALAGAGGLLLIGLAAGWAVPTTVAELQSNRGDELVRAGRPDAAVAAYLDAAGAGSVPDAEPYRKAANAAAYANRPAAEVAALLARALAADPAGIGDRVRLADVYVSRFNPPRTAEAMSLLAEATRRNPNDLQIRQKYADVLEASGDRAGAAAQLRRVLEFNDGLNPDEPERLSAAQVEAIKKRAEELRSP